MFDLDQRDMKMQFDIIRIVCVTMFVRRCSSSASVCETMQLEMHLRL